ncbi:SDR family NAD(P)-dependent oxidoreductase [Candidatus Skiveiella danica]|uniref:SDR family NAD(P)-dependent oxidoreductase n=1 Tax=Candidatus Skiveiella danica TaxID=3386177 RepID=UPI0039B82791
MAAIKSKGGEAVACVGGVTATDFADRFIRTAMDNFRGIDIIVNNAMRQDAVVEEMTDEQWRAFLDVH